MVNPKVLKHFEPVWNSEFCFCLIVNRKVFFDFDCVQIEMNQRL